MTDPFSDYIDSSVKNVLGSSGYMALSIEERTKVESDLKGHFENLIIETFLNRLPDEKAAEIKNNLSNMDILEEKFTEYASQIPGLAEDIEARLEREIEALKLLAS